jgi:hypothetical protein
MNGETLNASERRWFVYFRIYGPEHPAFDSTWQLPDFTRVD